MTLDVSGLSAKELEALVKQARTRKAVLQKRPSIAKARAKIVEQAARLGYSIEELFGVATVGGRAGRKAVGAGRTGKRSKVPPKYRNPANPEETWSGRGRQPRWLAALAAKGKPLDKFLIKE